MVRARLPIKKNLLNLILVKIEEIFGTQPYLQTLYKALFSTTFFGLFRIGEVTESQHVVKACNVHIATNKRKMMFILFTSKTHGRDKKPQTIKISSQTLKGNRKIGDEMRDCCPNHLLRQYVRICGDALTSTEQFFIFKGHIPVQPLHMRNVLKLTLQMIGLEPKYYGIHSMRIGYASQMADAGISVESIRKIGRWTSGAIYRYLR